MDTRYHMLRPAGGEAGDALMRRGLAVLVGGPERSPGVPLRGNLVEVKEKVDGFLAYAQSITLDPHRQVLALTTTPSGEQVIAGMCLWVPSPGRTAMLFGPGLSEFPEAAPPTQAAIVEAQQDAKAHGIVLVQAMLEPADAAGKTVYAAAGLGQLATLTYMERRPPVQPPPYALPADLTLAPYEAATHDLFREAIARSYQATLDCPALSEMRNVDDVIAGHKATGVFDPQLWGVLLPLRRNGPDSGQPLGCLLLAKIPAREALELVYLGLTPEARGQGLGRILMRRVLAIASRRNFAVATLAVDAANGPAVRLYRRCGYASVAQRVAMVRKLA
jgi:mycothiol synthase